MYITYCTHRQIVAVVKYMMIASEASIILLGLRARTNKAKLSDAEGKIRGPRKYMSSNSVIPYSLASTMYIYVELTILYIFASKKMQICVFKLAFWGMLDLSSYSGNRVYGLHLPSIRVLFHAALNTSCIYHPN